jgi:hypothetical protein
MYFGFTSIEVDGEERLVFLYHMYILVADSKKTNELRIHLERMQVECAGRTLQFDQRRQKWV